MSSIRTNTPKSQRQLQTTLALALVVPLSLVISQAQQLQQGVSVQMPHTTQAVTYPAADNADAWVVAVTAEGQLYFGVKSVTPDQLLEEMKITPRHRDARLYIKADARTPFSSVKAALGSARSAEFEQVVLLTSQPGSPSADTVVPPKGIAVQLVPPRQAGPIVVRLSNHAEAQTVTVNDKNLAWSELESTLKSLVLSPDQVVQVEANDAVRYADVIHALDEARKAGATVALPIFHSI